MDGALEEPVGPVREHVADVDEHGRGGVVLGAGGLDGDGGPGRGGGEDLEAGLAAEAEEELQMSGVVLGGMYASRRIVSGKGRGRWTAHR